MSHWKRNMQYKNKISLRIRTQTKMKKNQETSFCAWQRASMTIEASFIVPFMAGFLAIILFFFRAVGWRVARARQQRSTLTRLFGGACGVITPSKIYFRLDRRCAARSSLLRRGAFTSKMSG